MSFSSSYLQLDGVEFKISDVVNPPALPTLPKEFKMKDISKLLSDSNFDFSLETSVLAKISSVREAEKKMAEKEKQRKMQSMKRRADAEKRRLEEMMSHQREVLQKKREEFLEQKRKKKQDDNSPGNTSPSDVSSASSVPPTYENLKIPARNPFSSVQDGILTPQPVVGKSAESTTKLNQSQPVVSGQNQIWEDFEDKELDPFTNVELKTIDDLAELQTVLQNARIGQGLTVTSHASITTREEQNPGKPSIQIKNQASSPSSDNSSEDAQNSAPLYENISLQEVNDIATKLGKQSEDSLKNLLKNTQNESSISSNPTKSTPRTEHNTKLTPSNSPEPVYSKVHKKQPGHLCGNNQPKQVQTSLNPNNPFLSTSGFGATTAQPLPGFSPSLEETSVSQSSLYANLFNPVSTGFFPSNIAVNTNSNPSSSSPVFDQAATSQSGVSNPASNHVDNSAASKVLPVSFGPTSTSVTTPNFHGSSSANKVNNPTANIPQNARVPHKPPIPAPRKPAIPPRQSPSFSSTAPNGAQTSTEVPVKGQAHLLPPYAIPSSSAASSTAPSTDSGFINKSKQDRAKFAETVNKALSSLPQNPAPVKKKPRDISNHEAQPTPTAPVTRTLSLKSSLIAGLTPEEQTFVKNMMSMGFEGEATVRAMQQFGLNDKEVVDHLIQVQGIMEQGYASRTVQDALEMFPKDGKLVVIYLTKLKQLTDMGFPEDKVRDALKTHNNDQAMALDQLMEAT